MATALTDRKDINPVLDKYLVTDSILSKGSVDEIFYGAMLHWTVADEVAEPIDGSGSELFAGFALEGNDTASKQIGRLAECRIRGLVVAGTPAVGALVYCSSDDTDDLSTADGGNDTLVGKIAAYNGTTCTVWFSVNIET